jgi:hypothetical protein
VPDNGKEGTSEGSGVTKIDVLHEKKQVVVTLMIQRPTPTHL